MLKLEEVNKIYNNKTKGLSGIDMEIKEGEFVAILGPSGAGKSTLLRCINRIIDPTYGRIFIKGKEITSLSGRKLYQIRQHKGLLKLRIVIMIV